MKIPGKKRSLVLLSVFLSLALHALLLAAIGGVRMDLHGLTHAKGAKAPPRPMRVQSVDLRNLVFEANRTRLNQPTATLGFQDPHKNVRALFEKMDLLPKPPPVARLEGLGKNVVAAEPQAAPAPQMPAAPPVKIVEIDASKLPKGSIAPGRELSPKIPRQELVGDHVPGLTGGEGGGSGEAVSVGMRLGGLPDIPLRPGELDLATPPGTGLPGGQTPAGGLVTGNRTAGNLDSLVTVTMTVYDPGRNDGGFFRIDIAPNPASTRLRSIPKDMLFLLDCSASISPAKLDQFKAGIRQLLPQLRPADRFNVIAFRDQPEAVFTRPLPVTDDAVRRADYFVNRQERGGLTDVYTSLEPYVKDGRTAGQAGRPVNVFLLSDGKSTVRNKLDNDTFIRKVAGLRHADVSIYSFSAGGDANLFLMDLLAYSNRGASMTVEHVTRFAPEMSAFIQAHADLIVADLRYRATGELAREIFPRQLPHLYRDEALSIYGKFPAGATVVGLQILGRDFDGREQELVFSGDLRTAPRGDSKIAQQWAAQKVFTLLVDRVMNPKADVTDEIRRLAKEYGFSVPYL
jgi:hypothetical protein